MNCPQCQTPNDPDARFCKNCGAPLGPEETTVLPAHKPRRRLPLAAIIGGGLLVAIVAALAVFLVIRQQGPAQPGTVAIGPEGGTLSLADGAQLTLPPEAMSGPLRLRASALPMDQFLTASPEEEPELATAAAQLPPHLSLRSAVYHFEVVGPPPGAALLSLPIPAGVVSPHALDLYAWDGSAWHWLPTRIEAGSGTISAELKGLPAVLALMQTEPGLPTVSADLPTGLAIPAEGREALSELLVTGLRLKPDGSIETDPQVPTQPEPGARVKLIPSLCNWRDDGTLTADAAQVLADPSLRRRHVDAVVGLVLAGGYPAVQVDYHGLELDHRQIFSTFVEEVAAALHGQGRSLLVRVAAPVQVSATRWETGAYDWAFIGQAADRLQVPLSTASSALSPEQAQALLSWAVGQVDRTRLQPMVSMWAQEASAGGVATRSRIEAMAQLGPVLSTMEGDSIEPGDQIALSLAGLSPGSLEMDEASGLLHFEVSDEAGEAHQFYLPTDASLHRWLGQIAEYNLAGVALEGLLEASPGPRTWEMLQAYQASAITPVESEPVWVWTVSQGEASGEALSVETRPLSEASYEWAAPDTPGEYQVGVALSTDSGASTAPMGSLVVRVALAPTPTPTPAPTPTPTPDTSDEDVLPTSAPEPTEAPPPPPPAPTPAPLANCPDSRSTITYPANGATIRGIVPFIGTAYLDNLQYYKFEYRPLGAPNWQFLTQFDYKWVTNDKLMDWHTYTVAPGTYDIRLIVVDMSGNYPPPCEIRVTVKR
jgi:hypothetical protein